MTDNYDFSDLLDDYSKWAVVRLRDEHGVYFEVQDEFGNQVGSVVFKDQEDAARYMEEVIDRGGDTTGPRHTPNWI